MTDNSEIKKEYTISMLEIEMSDTSIENNKFITYKQQISNINPETLANVASMFKINRSGEWGATVWELSNVLITEKSGKQFVNPLKEAVNLGESDNLAKFELKMPSLRVIFTDGCRQWEATTPVSTKLGILDQWIRASDQQIWFKKMLLAGNLLYYEVPTTYVQTLRQLSMTQQLFDLYGANTVYIYVKSRDKQPIITHFESREQALIDVIRRSSQKRDNISFKTYLTKELRETLPKALDVNDRVDPILPINKDGIINWDILIVDSYRAFKFDGDLFPNAMVAAIDCQQVITKQTLMDIEKKLAAGRNDNIIQCLISSQQASDEKFQATVEYIMASRDTLKLDLIVMMGFGSFIRLPNTGKYIYVKDCGLALLYHLIGQQTTKNNPCDISAFIGCY